ncbi:endonuclease [Flavobacterium sp.]|uniref:endonuclease n=1 Tax=Flavobacterium sp. TaxID=239 RepID=UPI0026098FFC|nr:endonuclease [Flavobacterium sp.]MDD3003511.1 endonuclease [Flavobacterium sp.]
MRIKYLFLFLLNSFLLVAQQGAPASYYTGMNWNQSATNLKNALATKIATTHTNFLSYAEIWNATKITDLDPSNSNNVLLLYGWENGTDSDVTNDISRNKNSNGGNNGQWNREHVYAKGLGTPELNDGGSSDAGEDAHHIRSSDVQRNNSRGSLRFANGSGNSGPVIGGWYPGDQWKGDVARMMMYMYLRYGSQCLPKNVGVIGATTVNSDTNMIQLFLQWNAEDPVSAYEDARNTYHGSTATYAQRNRNPFIDNPYLATVIWGGPIAENRWPTVYLSTPTFDLNANLTVYPNPTYNNKVSIASEIPVDEIILINTNGQIMQQIQNPATNNNSYSVENVPQGFYFLRIRANNQTIVKKVIVN